jgi:hypothetical protein
MEVKGPPSCPIRRGPKLGIRDSHRVGDLWGQKEGHQRGEAG